MRVVSLLSSATEIVCALGLEKSLVGRSHECDYPASVLSLPACTEPAIDVSGTSLDIDRRVRAAVKDALSIYKVHDELLSRLKPDVLLTQTQCEVCAVSLRDVEAAFARRAGLSSARVVSLCPNRLSDLYADIRRAAEALEASAAGEKLCAELQARMAAVAQKTAGLPKPRVAALEWLGPLMAAGNWVPELIAMAGGAPVFGEAGRHSPALSWEELSAADPDLIFISPCGFGLARTREEAERLWGRPEWKSLRAVRQGRVFLADGNQYFNRPGPRLADSLDILAEIIHPEAFGARYRGAWQPLA